MATRERALVQIQPLPPIFSDAAPVHLDSYTEGVVRSTARRGAGSRLLLLQKERWVKSPAFPLPLLPVALILAAVVQVSGTSSLAGESGPASPAARYVPGIVSSRRHFLSGVVQESDTSLAPKRTLTVKRGYVRGQSPQHRFV